MESSNEPKLEIGSKNFSDLKDIPRSLKHKPVIACNYDDADAKYLSVGHAQYNKNEASIKLFRHTGKKWSRQSEEVPVVRVADMTLILLSAIKKIYCNDNSSTFLNEEILLLDDLRFLKNSINNNKDRIKKSLQEIKNILNSINLTEL